jgi:hypothetical protein
VPKIHFSQETGDWFDRDGLSNGSISTFVISPAFRLIVDRRKVVPRSRCPVLHRAVRERSRERSRFEEGTVHINGRQRAYSITSSARASSVSGMVSSNVFAVFKSLGDGGYVAGYWGTA